jgi:hypothetical protein
MTAVRPQLHLVDLQTGELVPQDDREILIEQLQGELKGKSLQIGKLKRELRELRSVEPEAETVREILEYWRERCSPRATLAPGGKRWEKVRARLKDKLDDREPWTPAELKLAVDGALLDPWLSGKAKGSKGYLDAETIYRDAEQVEKCRNLALGFQASAGIGLGDLLDVIDQLGGVDWKHILQVCVCGCRRFEHSRPDPNFHGREGCLAPGCSCDDFDMDFEDKFNQRIDPWLRHFWGKEAA